MKTWKKPFFIVWSGQALSLLSSEIVQFAVIWWLTYETGSAAALSIATIISLLPAAVLNPIIGALVDKWNRRAILIISDLIIALCSLCLAFLFLTGAIRISHIYLILLLRAVGGCFHKTAMLSSTSLMVPRKQLTRIAGINQTLNGIIMFAAPPLGGLLLKLTSFELIMLIDVIGALTAVVPLIFIKIPQPVKSSGSNQKNGVGRLLKDIAEGFRYIKNWPGAAGMLVISTSVNFIIRPVFMLSAIFVTSHFAGDEIDFGLLGAAVGCGFMTGGIVLSIWQGFKRKMVTSLTGIIGAGIAVLVSGLLSRTAFIPALFSFFAAGFMMPLCMGPIQSLVQSSVAPSMQGRTFSIMSSLSTIVSPISLLAAGYIFDQYSPQLWYFRGGIAIILIGISGFLIKKVRNIGPP